MNKGTRRGQICYHNAYACAWEGETWLECSPLANTDNADCSLLPEEDHVLPKNLNWPKIKEKIILKLLRVLHTAHRAKKLCGLL